MKWSREEAFAARRAGISRAKFPNKDDQRAERPYFSPRFDICPGDKVFTIGSCFARNIERQLAGDYELPTQRFNAPYEEAPHSTTNTLLNEYNPGTMSQRIEFALGERDYPDSTIVPTTDGFLDLSLPGGYPVTLERAKERRREIADIYSMLPACKVVIVTLGLIEAWFDKETGLYLNQMPPQPLMKVDPERYEFHRIEFEDALPMLDRAMWLLVKAGLKVLVTVSPVPLGSSFSGDDAVIANEYSKATLRLCAQRLFEKYPEVDYFPSYEIVRLRGRDAFQDDNVHVENGFAGEITDYMLSCYHVRRSTADEYLIATS